MIRPRPLVVLHVRRATYVAAYVGISLAFCLLLGLCSACIALARPAPHAPRYGLNQAEQFAAAGHVTAVCGNGWTHYGSAVLVSPTQALTAMHVIDCPDPLVVVEFDPEHVYPAFIEVVSVKSDIARLRLNTPAVGLEPARQWGPVRAGETVCAATAHPEAGWSCGQVTGTAGVPGADVRMSVPVEHGNSGSGLYDTRGLLVGIVTRCSLAFDEDCDRISGAAASITATAWVMP